MKMYIDLKNIVKKLGRNEGMLVVGFFSMVIGRVYKVF